MDSSSIISKKSYNMRKYLILFFLAFTFNHISQEDTTFIQAHNYVDLDWNGNYDAWANFPDGSQTYRKILMHYDMRCSSSGCSGWDYTTKIIILDDDGTDENGNQVFSNAQTLANVVTPYGTYMQGSGTEGFSPDWVHRYTYDVTDFAHLLVDSVKMRAFYGGWSTGFNVTLNFEFIHGTPPRNVIDVQNLWSGSNSYSNIDDILTDTVVFIPENAKNSAMRVTISGHGQDGEFTPGVNYFVKIDNQNLYTQEIWRDDCGEVALYPQGGTWIYDRANWCPGDKATTRLHELTEFVQTGQNNIFDFDINRPNWNPSEASYIYDVQLITYSEPNFTLDVAMDDIISPSKKDEHFRFNPSCSNPIVKIKNIGSQNLTSVLITYGFDSFDPNFFLWEGNLSYGESEIVNLPPIDWFSWETNYPFYARVSMPNGQPEDEHLVNDVLYSDYDFVQEYPNNFAMWFKTNSYPNESSYELSDNFGNIIFSKSGMQANTLYKDTFNLSPGCYKLQILDTGGNQNTNEDGLSWWANDDGSGYARLRAVPGGFFKYYQDDFGTELTDYFRVGEYSISMLENLKEPLYRIYPNPSKNQLNVEFNSPEITDYNFSIYDLNGKKIFSSDNNTARVNNFDVNLEFMENGLYNCVVKTSESVYSKSLVIIK